MRWLMLSVELRDIHEVCNLLSEETEAIGKGRASSP